MNFKIYFNIFIKKVEIVSELFLRCKIYSFIYCFFAMRPLRHLALSHTKFHFR